MKNALNRTIRHLAALSLLASLTAPVTATAQVERYVAGTHYVEIRNPVTTRDPSKVEVVEAFWYGCVHCFRFQPLIENWVAEAPAHVDFVRFPAIFNAQMDIHARVYYTAEALDALDALHEPIFNAINVERNRLLNESQIGDLFSRHGISDADFTTAFNSFSVRTRVNQARSRTSAYQVQSTPNMVVNGKYLVFSTNAVPTQHAMLEVVDFLVEKERRALGLPG